MADGVLTLPGSGRQVEISRSPEEVVITGPSGVVELRIRLTPEGPVLVATGPLKLTVPDALLLQAKSLDVRTDGDLRLSAGGDVIIEGQLIHLN